ncbi:hypothetical protein LDENG_00236400 [Lucifuga dentata]|nr:hypothetical protein LDENG_00236400 [Lucifuga dentata]
MSDVTFGKSQRTSKVWIALKRFDKNDDRVVALRDVSFPLPAEPTTVRQIITSAFGLDASDIIFKIRNHHGRLIPLNSSIPANSKHIPYVLEVAKIFQHVYPKPRTIPMTMISKRMNTRLQTIDRRKHNLSTHIQRLEDLLPHIKLRRNEKLSQEIECLNQKLRFLHKRMQVADSHSWKGVLTRAPLW